MVEIQYLEPEKKKQKSKKQKKEKKSKRESVDEAPTPVDDVLEEPTTATHEEDAKKKKREKKQKKRKRSKEQGEKDVVEKAPEEENVDTTEMQKELDVDEGKTKKKRKDKRMEKEELLAKIPKTNELGVSFTKIEIRKMLKRVKKGLPPIPTSAERKRLKMEKRDEETELAGMLYNREGGDDTAFDAPANVNVSGDATDTEDAEDDNDGIVAGSGSDTEAANGEEAAIVEGRDDAQDEAVDDSQESVSKSAATKKKARSKPVPDDYVCFSCKNKHTPRHWIYDCPDKVTVRGTNKVKKKLRGVNDPSSQKVFVSGLPYEMKRKDLISYFEEKCKNTKVVDCKMLSFEDTGRFKGQAYLTLDSDASAKMALQLDGSTFEVKESEGKDDKGKGVVPKKRWLKVTKVLNRVVTKKMHNIRKRTY